MHDPTYNHHPSPTEQNVFNKPHGRGPQGRGKCAHSSNDLSRTRRARRSNQHNSYYNRYHNNYHNHNNCHISTPRREIELDHMGTDQEAGEKLKSRRSSTPPTDDMQDTGYQSSSSASEYYPPGSPEPIVRVPKIAKTKTFAYYTTRGLPDKEGFKAAHGAAHAAMKEEAEPKRTPIERNRLSSSDYPKKNPQKAKTSARIANF
ncbi:hypothetical protein HOY82DRAFT_640996 [Tuber indicum]|nr:hypothetical protein HOY82DRAFT_640996 [Tuber indicum]